MDLQAIGVDQIVKITGDLVFVEDPVEWKRVVEDYSVRMIQRGWRVHRNWFGMVRGSGAWRGRLRIKAEDQQVRGGSQKRTTVNCNVAFAIFAVVLKLWKPLMASCHW